MRTYEELFIVKPDAAEEETVAYIGQIKDLIAGSGGKIEKEDMWGIRKLAYRVLKYSEGRYVLLVFQASPGVVAEIERRMRVSDLVIKFITVRVDARMKKIDKRRKHREKRAARRPPPPPAPPPAMPGEAAAHTPGAPLPGAPVPAAPMPAAPAAPATSAPAPTAPVAVEESTEGTGE